MSGGGFARRFVVPLLVAVFFVALFVSVVAPGRRGRPVRAVDAVP